LSRSKQRDGFFRKKRGQTGIAAPYLQKDGTKAGVFFDTETLEPNTQLPGFADALDIYKRLLAASARLRRRRRRSA